MRRLIKPLMLGALLCASASATAATDCTTTPFGQKVAMLPGADYIDLISTNPLPGFPAPGTSFNAFDEYGPQPNPPLQLNRTYRAPLPQGGISSSATFLKAVHADLNGDGRDEIVAAYNSGNQITLGIYERTTGLSPSAQLVGTYNTSGNFIGFDMVAGDFSGHRNGQQDLAIFSNGQLQFLTAPLINGTLQLSSLASAGSTNLPVAGGSLAKGDFLLDGRDQVVVTSVDNSYTVTHVLAELQTPNPLAFQFGQATNVGYKIFRVDSLSSIPNDKLPGSSYTTSAIWKVLSSGGDVVDDAAAELVDHYGFHYSGLYDAKGNSLGGSGTGIAQRLTHFNTTRALDANGNPTIVTGISIATGQSDANGNDTPYDDQKVVYAQSGIGDVDFEAVLGDIDGGLGADPNGSPKAEIVLASHPTDNNNSNFNLTVSASKATVAPQAEFMYSVDSTQTISVINTSTNAWSSTSTFLWDYGNGHTSTNPVPNKYRYSYPGTYTLKLTATDGSYSNTYAVQIDVTRPGSGGISGLYGYRLLDPTPDYVAATAPDSNNNPQYSSGNFDVAMAVGSLSGSNFNAVMVLARDQNNQLQRQVFQIDPANNFKLTAEPALVENDGNNGNTFANIQAMSVLPSDFAGASIYAAYTGTCADVTDGQVRAMVWEPPYFSLAQPVAGATFGQSNSSSTSLETSEGHSTSNSVTGSLGVKVTVKDPNPLAILTGTEEMSLSIKVSAGHEWQSSHTSVHSDDTGYTFSTTSTVTGGEGLTQMEQSGATCYLYAARTSAGDIPNSGMRICDQHPELDVVSNTSAADWDNLGTQGAQPSYQPAAGWVPLEHDWASMALFDQKVSTNATLIPTGPAEVANGASSADATDGLFSTPVVSSKMVEPFLDIDLGSVRDIAAIRVFPAADTDSSGNLAAPLSFRHGTLDLRGFRLYVSMAPFNGPAVPGADANAADPCATGNPTILSAAPGVVRFGQCDGLNQASFSSWNIWTRNPANNQQMLRGRYLRLQHPGPTQARLNISEIQVFGDAHLEPQSYPAAVCAPTSGAGYFLASVFNPSTGFFQNIEVRGEMQWSGANTKTGSGYSTNLGNCSNNSALQANVGIWDNTAIPSSGIGSQYINWQLSNDLSSTNSQSWSSDQSTRFGVELEATATWQSPLDAVEVEGSVGVAYEFNKGVTHENSTSTTTGTGLDVSGTEYGFNNPTLGNACTFQPQPYGFDDVEYSNLGFRHDIYTVDYVVTPKGFPAWDRRSVPAACGSSDRIFYDNFDLYH